MNDWLNDARCDGYPTEWWFPERGRQGETTFQFAKRICDTCPVQQPCLDEALETEVPGLRYGYRGAASPRQRDAIGRQAGYVSARRPLTPCPSNAAYTRHIRAGQEPCKGCSDAHRVYMEGIREYRRSQRRAS